jgi:acetate kinase
MKTANASILTINGGASSIKFAMYQGGEPLQRRAPSMPRRGWTSEPLR